MILAIGGFWSVILAIVVFIVILGVTISLHELGHMYFAKKAGILCHEFSIGMGPVLFKKRKGETVYSIRAIPIGGFVSMAGEEVSNDVIKIGSKIGLNFDGNEIRQFVLDNSMQSDVFGEVVEYDLYGEKGSSLYFVLMDEEGTLHRYNVRRNAFYVFSPTKSMQITPYDRSFESKSLLQRFLTIFAGPFMNLVLALVLLLFFWFFVGIPNYNSTIIGEVDSSFNGANYLVVGDKITAVKPSNSEIWDDVSTWKEFSNKMSIYGDAGDTTISFKVERDGTIYNFDIPCVTIINSIGLTDFKIKEEYKNQTDLPSEAKNGIQVGEVSINYKGDLKKGEKKISNGDIITQIKITDLNDKTTQDWTDVSSWGQVIRIFENIDISRIYFKFYSQESKQIEESLTYAETYGNELLDNQRIDKLSIKVGISPKSHFSFFGSIKYAFTSFWSDFTLIFRTLKILIAPSGVRQVGVESLSGIVGIFSLVKSYMSAGFWPLISFTALLSVNIGVMNLLPIPALDGGRILFLAYELITRKKPNKKVENTINNVVFILILLFFFYVTYNDILRIFK